MKRASLLWLLLAWAGPSQDATPAADTPEGRTQLVDELCKTHDDALEAFWKAWQEVAGDEARSDYLAEHFPKVDRTAERLLTLVEKHPGEEAGFKALSWLTGMQLQCPAPILARVHGQLAAHYLDYEGLENVLRDLAYNAAPSAGNLLEAALERSSRKAIRGQACYAYAHHLLRRASLARRLEGLSAEELEVYIEDYGASVVTSLQGLDLDESTTRVEQLLERVMRDYGDLPAWSGTLGKAARGDLFELRELAIGKVAPEIEGEDLFGVPLKLSDYRGKVVVLDFWGHW